MTFGKHKQNSVLIIFDKSQKTILLSFSAMK